MTCFWSYVSFFSNLKFISHVSQIFKIPNSKSVCSNITFPNNNINESVIAVKYKSMAFHLYAACVSKLFCNENVVNETSATIDKKAVLKDDITCWKRFMVNLLSLQLIWN